MSQWTLQTRNAASSLVNCHEGGRTNMGQRAYTLLHSAAQDGDLNAVVSLLARGKNPNHFDECGCTPLHYAAAGGHIKVVKTLLADGAKVNSHDEGVIGNTA